MALATPAELPLARGRMGRSFAITPRSPMSCVHELHDLMALMLGSDASPVALEKEPADLGQTQSAPRALPI